MNAMAKSNLEQKDARQVQYDAESEAQRHRNVGSEANKVKKVRDLSSANENRLTAQCIANESQVVAMRR